MLKRILLLSVFLLCTGIGVIYVLDLAARRRQISQILHLIRYFRREIRCTSLPIGSLIREFPSDLPVLRAMDVSEPFDLPSAYQTAKESCRCKMLLKSEEWQAFDALFSSLGEGDCKEQEVRLNLCEQAFSEFEKAAKDAMGKNGKPALVLSCSAGAILVLMLL